MKKLGLFRSNGTIADICPAGLERLEIGTGRDLPIELLPRQPHLEVICFSRRKSHIPCAKQHSSIRETKALQDGLSMAGQAFVFCTGVLRSCKLDQLHLLKLVLTDHAADIL